MNSKAKKISLTFPLGLNLSENHLKVDSQWGTFDKCNSPYINGMYMPFYLRTSDESLCAYDASGTKMTVRDGHLYRGDVEVSSLSGFKFVKEELDLSDYLSWDDGAWLVFNDEDNTISCSNGVTTPSLYAEGSVVTARIRKLSGHILAFIYYINDLGEARAHIIYDGDQYDLAHKWYTLKPRRTSSAAYLYTEKTGVSAYPLIQMTMLGGYPVFSLVSEWGSVLATDEVAFCSYCVYNGSVYYGGSLMPSNQTFTAEVTDTTTATFTLTPQVSVSTPSKSFLRRSDGSGGYEYLDYDTHESVTPPTTQSFADTGMTEEVDGETWSVVNTSMVTSTITVTVTNTSNLTDAWGISVNGGDEITSSNNSATASLSHTRFSTDETSFTGIETIDLIWRDETSPMNITSSAVQTFTRTVTSTQTGLTYAVAPNVILDDGTMYSLYSFNPSTSSWTAYNITTGLRMIDSARFTSWNLSGSTLYYNFNATEVTSVVSGATCMISNSASVGQNFFASTTKMGANGNTPSVAATSGLTSNNSFLEWHNSSCGDKTYWPGTSPYVSKNYNGDSGWSEGYLTFTVGGYRALGHSSSYGSWNLLYHTYLSGASGLEGISWSQSPSQAGTLITEWDSVDGTWPVSFTDTSVTYKDNSGRWWRISIEEGTEIASILNGRLVILNTTDYLNTWDGVRMTHAFTDYNDRVTWGTKTASNKTGEGGSTLTATAINNSYGNTRYPLSSSNFGTTARSRVGLTAHVERYVCPESLGIQGVDIYWGSSSASYVHTIIPEISQFVVKDSKLLGTVFQVRSGHTSPSMFIHIVDGSGNTDMIVEEGSSYPLVYDVDTPVLLFNASSQLNNVTAVFVLQGQYYAVINDKIYSLVYSNGSIVEMDAIIETRGLTFVGNTPSIAFFWNEAMRAFYSFTGDANMNHVFDASKIKAVKEMLSRQSFCYDEGTQSIFIPTDIGLLCLGPLNTYLLPQFKDVVMMYFTGDGLTHVVETDKVTDLSYYLRDGFASNGVELETEFFGMGSTEMVSVDKWNFKIYSQNTSVTDDIRLSVGTLNDISVKSEDKLLTVNPQDWDEGTSSVLLSYAPKYIKGQGVKVGIKTLNAVESVIPHVMDDNTGTLTRKQA